MHIVFKKDYQLKWGLWGDSCILCREYQLAYTEDYSISLASSCRRSVHVTIAFYHIVSSFKLDWSPNV